MEIDSHVRLCLNTLRNSTMLVTGATGLIGSQLIFFLASLNEYHNANIQIVGHARSKEKAELLLQTIPKRDYISFIYGDIATDSIHCEKAIDYIVHAAAPTASSDFINHPIRVITANLKGVENLLEFASTRAVRKMVFLSTMEVYGISVSDRARSENDYSTLDHLVIRSSYPESKKMAETMCRAWFHEKQIPVCIARLTQTFGKGVPYSDGRVFAQFGRAVLEKKDIVLHTSGATKRNYLGIQDAITAIITLLAMGEPGEAYNVANDTIYVSIKEMAQLVAKDFGDGVVKVISEELTRAEDRGYAPELRMNLSTAKLRAFGWQPTQNLTAIYAEMLNSWR